MRKIHINGRFLFSGHPTGTHRSSEGFARSLIRIAPEGHVILHASSKWPRAKEFIEETNVRSIEVNAHSTRATHLWEQFVFPPQVAGEIGLNLIGTGPAILGGSRQVMLVHDLNSLLMPSAFSAGYKLWSRFAKYRAIARSGKIFCLTEYVKTSIRERLGIPGERIKVIPQGPGLPRLEELDSVRPRGARTHFLCAGSLQPHKNLEGVLTAWKLSGLAEKGHRLIVSGKRQKNFSGTTASLDSMDGVEYAGFVDDDRLEELYRGAIALVYPSFHEGFGLPIVEAFFAGTPVITSNVSCLPEVAGPAGILVDPSRPSEIADAMNLMASNECEWNARSLMAWNRRIAFLWENAGRELWDWLLPARC